MAEKGNYVYRVGTTPNTRLLNTLKVKIYSFDSDGTQLKQIGLVQDWGPSHTRTITAQRGIGFGDQIAELGVGVTELTATATVMGMYLRNLMQVFGYKADTSGLVRSIKHHKWPFDVKEEIHIPEFIQAEASFQDTGAIVTWYEGCWMQNWDHTFSIGDVNVSQSCTVSITDVTDGVSVYGEDITDVDTAQASRLFSSTSQQITI